jgi:hypothetical protein
LVFPVLPYLLDLSVVLIEKGMGIAVVDQTSDHAGSTAIVEKIYEKVRHIIVAMR